MLHSLPPISAVSLSGCTPSHSSSHTFCLRLPELLLTFHLGLRLSRPLPLGALPNHWKLCSRPINVACGHGAAVPLTFPNLCWFSVRLFERNQSSLKIFLPFFHVFWRRQTKILLMPGLVWAPLWICLWNLRYESGFNGLFVFSLSPLMKIIVYTEVFMNDTFAHSGP